MIRKGNVKAAGIIYNNIKIMRQHGKEFVNKIKRAL